MKKYIVNLLLLFVAQNVWSMELSIKQDQKCYFVAKYLTQWPGQKKTIDDFVGQESNAKALLRQVIKYQTCYSLIQSEADKLQQNLLSSKIVEAYNKYYYSDSGVQYELAYRYKDTPFIALLNGGEGIMNSDSLNEVLQAKIMSSSITEPHIETTVDNYEQGMLAMYARFSNEVFVVPSAIGRESLESIQQILDNYKIANCLTVQQLFDLCHNKPLTLKFETRSGYDIFFGSNTTVTTITAGLDFILKAASDTELLQKIAAASIADEDSKIALYNATQQDKDKLKELDKKLKDNPEWIKFKEVPIGFDLPKVPWYRTIGNKILLGIPLGLINGLIPWGVYSTVAGTLQGMMGFVGCGIAGFFIGDKLFPFMDSYHSDVEQMRQVYGEKGVREIKKGWQFASFGVINLLSHAVAEYLRKSPTSELQSLGMILHASRVCTYLFGIFKEKNNDKESHSHINNFFGNMSFSNPLLRRGQSNTAPNLGDMVSS